MIDLTDRVSHQIQKKETGGIVSRSTGSSLRRGCLQGIARKKGHSLMSDLEPHRNGRIRTSDGSDSTVRWGLLFSIAIHAVVVAPLIWYCTPPVYRPPASQMDVPFIEMVEMAQLLPETSSGASAISTSKTAAETGSLPAGEVSADMSSPEPILNAVRKPDPQPTVDAPPSKPPRQPPVKPVPAKAARVKPMQARNNSVEQAMDVPLPLGMTGAAARTVASSFPPSQSAKEDPNQVAIEYGRVVRSHLDKNIIYPQQDRSILMSAKAVVHFFILADGRVTDVKIVQSSGSDIIDRVAKST
ncbi:TonB family protein [Azospirillum sp. 11R-A]|uniref:TonB family protein n=1 Tax=Azospirillum sp. 11R-A TaxID=3111634 RepID=UPI003C1AFC70